MGSVEGVLRGLGLGGALYSSLLLAWAGAFPFFKRRPAWAKAWMIAVSRRAVPVALRGGGIDVVATGVENLEAVAKGGYILVPNHASNIDPMALMVVLDRFDLAFVAKAETLRRPLLGNLLKAVGWVAVERESLAALKKLQEDVKARVATGWVPELVVFPEGTRSTDGKLQKFQLGTFLLSAHLGLPIVPVIIRGTFPLHRKDAFLVQAGTVTVEFRPAIFPPPGKLKPLQAVDAAADLMKKTRAIFEAVPDLTVPLSVASRPNEATGSDRIEAK